MPGTTVRIRDETRELLRELAAQTGERLQDLIANAVESYRRNRLLADTNTAYAALRQDEAAWRDLTEERELWEATLGDGLAGEPPVARPR